MILCEHCFINPIKGKVECGIIHKEIIKEYMTKERIETPLFDEDSVREAIINAFVHNDWKNETPPTIFMFDDRFEIFSYGELPYGITQDMIFNGYSRLI